MSCVRTAQTVAAALVINSASSHVNVLILVKCAQGTATVVASGVSTNLALNVMPVVSVLVRLHRRALLLVQAVLPIASAAMDSVTVRTVLSKAPVQPLVRVEVPANLVITQATMVHAAPPYVSKDQMRSSRVASSSVVAVCKTTFAQVIVSVAPAPVKLAV